MSGAQPCITNELNWDKPLSKWHGHWVDNIFRCDYGYGIQCCGQIWANSIGWFYLIQHHWSRSLKIRTHHLLFDLGRWVKVTLENMITAKLLETNTYLLTIEFLCSKFKKLSLFQYVPQFFWHFVCWWGLTNEFVRIFNYYSWTVVFNIFLSIAPPPTFKKLLTTVTAITD